MKNILIHKNKINIIPDTSEYQDLIDTLGDKLHRISYTYLHGELEREVGYDIFCYYGLKNPIESGIHKCYFKKKECIFYLWKDKLNIQYGLVCYIDDVESIKYALECYQNKVINL